MRSLPVLLAAWMGCAAEGADEVAPRDVGAATDESIVELDPFAVIAHPSGAEERPAAVWVVRNEAPFTEDLRAGDLLQEVPGVHIDQPGGPGGRATLYVRGGEVNHVVMFYDGVPLNDPTNSRGGAVDLSVIDPAIASETAVVRGPPSVRYGPETLAGVVHFQADPDVTEGSHVTLEAGGDHLRRGHVSWRDQLSPQVAVSLSAAATEDGSLNQGTRMRRRFAHASVTSSGTVSIRSTIWHADHEADAFPDDSGGFQFAVLRDLERRENQQTGASISVGRESEHHAWEVFADAGRFDALVESPGVAPGLRDPAGLPASVDDTRLERWRIGGVREQAIGNWNLATGVEVQNEDGRATGQLDFGGFLVPTDFSFGRTRIGGFAEVDGLLADHTTVTAGVRVDDYDDGYTRATARAGVLHTTSANLQYRINVGTGFKPPSFYALAHPLVGNPDLRPERGTSIDAGVRGGFADDRGIWDVTVFDATFRDGIDFDAGPPPQLVNRARIRTRGVELATRYRPAEQWTVRFAAAFTDVRIQPGDERLRLRPRWRSGLRVGWEPLTSLTLVGGVEYVGSVPDSSIPTGDVTLDAWTRVDLAASWRFDSTFEATLAVDNVLDAEYEEAIGFPSPGRRIRLGLRASF